VKANRLVLLAVAGASVLALTGCAQTGNVAAQVGGRTVATSDVDFLTRMQCDSLNKAAEDPTQSAQGGVQMVPTSQIRTGMVNTLVQAELDRQLAAKEHLSYDTTTLRNAMVQFQSVLSSVPEADRDRFRSMVEAIYRGQLQLYALAQRQLADQGIANPTQDQVNQAIASIQEKYRKKVKIAVNPTYGAGDSGVAGTVAPSLSKPVSSFAKQAGSAQPDATWVGKLPADQRCG